MSTKVIKSSSSKDDVSLAIRPFTATETEADLNLFMERRKQMKSKNLFSYLLSAIALSGCLKISKKSDSAKAQE